VSFWQYLAISSRKDPGRKSSTELVSGNEVALDWWMAMRPIAEYGLHCQSIAF
jgi:hypothetical protein